MQSDLWIDLLRKIPTEYQDKLVLVSSVGLEISLQSVLRTEEHYVVLRGRLAGTNEVGRIFFVPYDQINFLGIQKVVKASEVHAMFGEIVEDTAADANLVATASVEREEEAKVEETLPHEAPAAPPASPAKGDVKPRFSKRELLARLRARSNDNGSGENE